jgi:AraC-like DNA-binding protein
VYPDPGAPLRSDEATALFLGPGLRFASAWREGCIQLMLKLDSRTVLRRWQQTLGSGVPCLPAPPPAIDLATPEGWRVQQILRLLRQEFERTALAGAGSLATTPLAGAALDAVFAYILAHHGDGQGRARLLPAPLKRCVGYILANLHRDLSVPVLLGLAGTSERTLFNLFRQFLDTSPKAYVRTERLKACRALLMQGGISVTEAARRSGFAHMGRFAGQYRAAFGEPPSATPADPVRFLHPPSRD